MSILEMQAAVVQGYGKANHMVDITQTLDRQQINALVEFLMQSK
ncbi:hypothetical protein N9B10_07520 [Pirellulales bacterium]|nr:hypothetical protein [Pirellulales bacterium]MDA7889297.1 hypothetical protein [Pirellulales bacterium]MDA7938086.1 hypothetical protein [Pirellulales bacterium]